MQWKKNPRGGAPLRAPRVNASEDSERSVISAGTVADDFPSKAAAHFSKGAGLSVAKHDGILRVEGDNEVFTVGSKGH